MNSNSHKVSTQETKGTTQTESRGNSIGLVSGFGFNRGINAGLSSSFGLAPSIMISHSRREFDEARENISRLYGSLKERLLVGLNTGIFSTSTYIMTPDNLVASKAKALIKSAFLNNELLSPIQILEPKEVCFFHQSAKKLIEAVEYVKELGVEKVSLPKKRRLTILNFKDSIKR